MEDLAFASFCIASVALAGVLMGWPTKRVKELAENPQAIDFGFALAHRHRNVLRMTFAFAAVSFVVFRLLALLFE